MTVWLVGALLVCCYPAMASAIPVVSGGTAPTGAPNLRKGTTKGELSLRLAGLPRGERGAVVLVGPPASPHSKRKAQRRLSLGTRRTIALPAGVYGVTVEKVKLRRGSGAIKRGAVAQPLRRTLRAVVKSGHTAKLEVRYGTILNPGIQNLDGRISRVIGNPLNPSEVVVDGGGPLQVGQVLSAPPSSELPHGLLVNVTGVSHVGGMQVAQVRAAGIYEVAPNMSFDIPLSTTAAASISKLADCKAGEVTPSAQVSDFHLTGGWTTTHVLFADIKTGATVELHYRVAAGVKVTSRLGVSCSLPLPEVGFEGMAGPIPVYGGFRPTASAELGAAASLSAGGSLEVTTGMQIGGLLPKAAPIVKFGSPRFEFNATTFAGLKARIGLDAELGIGAEDAANIHGDLGNELDFTAAPGKCSWDLTLGTFSATGEIGKFSISTPATGGLYHHNLWHASCGAPPAPAPAPAPAPPAPVPPSVPASGPTFVYTGESGLSPSFGDFEFDDWSAATGQPAPVEATLPSILTGYRCVVLLVNRSLATAQEQALSGYLQAGGTVVAIGEHESDLENENFGFDEADAALNGFASSLGVNMSLNDDSYDDGETVTDRIVPSPLTAGVTEIGDDWVSSLGLSGTAQPLVETADAPVPFIGYQSVGKGLFVMSGDSNAFTDNNQESYENQNNGRLVANLCP